MLQYHFGGETRLTVGQACLCWDRVISAGVWSERVPNPLVVWIKIWRFSGQALSQISKLDDVLRLDCGQGHGVLVQLLQVERGLGEPSEPEIYILQEVHQEPEAVLVPHRIREELTRAVLCCGDRELRCQSAAGVAEVAGACWSPMTNHRTALFTALFTAQKCRFAPM